MSFKKEDMLKKLNTYALIKSSWLQDDFISSLIPLATTLINKKMYSSIDAKVFSEDFSKTYFKITHHPTVRLLSLMQTKGYVKYNRDNCMWHPNFDVISDLDITEESNKINDDYSVLRNHVIDYAKQTYAIDMTAENVDSSFGVLIHSNSSEMLKGGVYFTDEKNHHVKIVADYIQIAIKEHYEISGLIKKIAIGRLLVDAVSFGEDMLDKNNFKNVSIYLDTRLILNIIGFYGEYREKTYCDLIDKLYKMGAHLYVFEHTNEEVNYILKGCEKWIDSTDYDPSLASSALKYLRAQNKSKKFVQELIIGVDNKYKKFHIDIDKFSFDGADYKYEIDRQRLTQTIEDVYVSRDVEMTDRVKETIAYDVDSIEAIYHKREGEKATFINKTKAFLLTTNRNLIFASKKFNDEQIGEYLPCCVSDVTVGSFVWINSGVKSCEEIIESKLISECAVAMEPTQYCINKFCECINNLQKGDEVTDAEVIALKSYGLSTESAKQFVIAGNDIEYKDIYEVLEEIKQDTIKSESAKFALEKEKILFEKDEINSENEKNKQVIVDFRKQVSNYKEKERKTKENKDTVLQNSAEKAKKLTSIVQMGVNSIINIFLQVLLFFFPSINGIVEVVIRIILILISLVLCIAIKFNWGSIKTKMIKAFMNFYVNKEKKKEIKTETEDFIKTLEITPNDIKSGETQLKEEELIHK